MNRAALFRRSPAFWRSDFVVFLVRLATVLKSRRDESRRED
jgi:hypothetical protein